MKKLAYVIAVMSIGVSACRNNDIHLELKESPETLLIKAEYPKEKTDRVNQYINDACRTTSLLGSEDNQVDRETVLADGTNFHLTASPGKLEITLVRNRNSTLAYQQVKKIGEGLGAVLHQSGR